MLIVKRAFEYPKRSQRIFTLDVSKQAFSAGWQHTLNVALAVFLVKNAKSGNECEWYFVNFVCEFCFGVFLSFMIHKFVMYFANKYDILILQSGVYLSLHEAQYVYMYEWEELDKHINYRVWGIQLVVWLFIVTISKIAVFALEFIYSEEFISVGIYCLSFFDGHPNLELVFVMFIVPFTLNSLQYWIVDSFLQGTDYIKSQKANQKKNQQEMNHLYILQDGMVDFSKNRAAYRKNKGLDGHEASAANLELNQQNIENEFIMVNVSNRSNPDQVRKSYIVR